MSNSQPLESEDALNPLVEGSKAEDYRVVRLSTGIPLVEHLPPSTSARFGRLWQACIEIEPYLSKNFRPTLILLDPDDLMEGVLEGLLGISTPRTTKSAKALIEKIRSIAKSETDSTSSPLFLVICMAQPSLEAWESPGQNWPGWQIVKDREFFVRLLESYRVAITVGRITPDAKSQSADIIASRLLRSIEVIHNSSEIIDHWEKRLNRLGADVLKMRQIADLMLGGFFRRHAPPEWLSEEGQFLLATSRADQFGKRPVADVIAGIDRDVAEGLTIVKHFREGSYGLRQEMRRALESEEHLTTGMVSASASSVNLLQQMSAYHVLRDCARWLGDGAFTWARNWDGSEPGHLASESAQAIPFRALFIDENLRDSSDDALALRKRLSKVFSQLFPKKGLELFAIYDHDGALPTSRESEKISDSIVSLDNFFDKALALRIKRVENWFVEPEMLGRSDWSFSDAPKASLHDYNVIFIEVDYQKRFAGPQVVQKLASYLERTRRRLEEQARKSTKVDPGKKPTIIVLSHQDNFGHVQQCLNLGASAFVDKERLLQIPSRLRRAITDAQALSDDGETPMPRERFGEHSNFRALYSLRPDQAANLRSDEPKVRVGTGRNPLAIPDNVTERQRVVFESGTIPTAWDASDREWIHSLPKADLHCHFGTSIGLPTVVALAFNTCGHFFRNSSEAVTNYELLSAPVRVVVDNICKIVLYAELNRQIRVKAHIQDNTSPAFDYLAAARTVLGSKVEIASSTSPYELIIKALAASGPPIKEHLMVALLVAAGVCLRNGQEAKDVALRPWAYLERLKDWCTELSAAGEPASHPNGLADSNEGPHWATEFVVRAARLASRGAFAIVESMTPIENWGGRSKAAAWEKLRGGDADLKACADLWSNWRRTVGNRVGTAAEVVRNFLDKTLQVERHSLQIFGEKGGLDKSDDADFAALLDRASCPNAPSLGDLVALPAFVRPEEQTLLRYLWGTGLLGAEHLQYPENLLLAAQDLVNQNASDYVVYTELRCETPGYTRAGLSAEMATDLLCASFDLAAVYYADACKKTFVRTNLLLAAKRHKSPKEREKVVALLVAYLSRRESSRHTAGSSTPAWWRPAQVVGFDLSGNEAITPPDLAEMIVRLFELSSHITIHAGEAASAESVWQAVYEFHARRIGHGLRLRERANLLQFCINEGICMEMCPISNKFTSGFIAVEDRNSYGGHLLEHYPLRHFMESGLEVSINTDNRSLHGDYGTTLTDEYMWAARLSGGFTRWEILKLAKASFKHAFLDKRDVLELLQAAETWMFTQVANAPGLDWQPSRPHT